MSIYWPYFLPLLVVVALTITTGIRPMMRTALTLFIAYFVNTLVVMGSGVYDFWLFFIVSDAVAAWFVIHQPAGKIQSVIGGLLLTQIVVHGLYGISKFFNPETVSGMAYIQLLDVLGYLQLILLGGWAGGRWIASVYSRHRRRRLRMAGTGHRGSVA